MIYNDPRYLAIVLIITANEKQLLIGSSGGASAFRVIYARPRS